MASSRLAKAGLAKALRGSRHPVSPSWNPFGPAGSTGMPARPQYVSPGLLGRRLRHRNHENEGAVFSFGTVLHVSIDKGKQRMVDAYADVVARMPLGAALAHENVAGETALSAKQLHAQALAGRVTAVARGTACFLVCHCQNLSCPTSYSNSVTKSSPKFVVGDHFITDFRHSCPAAYAGWASLAVSPCVASLGFGLDFFALGGGVCDGFLPSVRISVIRTRVNSCR